ncbi:MAG TPA: M20/M25/M40 family metallo-hydrolase [Myxococcales bacterium]|nr:M20/M25/M40 family metallo-hydrolase [Myxococcales bacterium]
MLFFLFAIALAPARRDPRIEAIVQRIEPAPLQATVAKLVGFGTRHTLSETSSETRGIGAARRWLASQFAAATQGTRLKPFEDRFTAEPSRRIPAPTELINVGVILPGGDAARAKQAIVMTGHYDSIPSDVMDARSDAPGAVDDGSGTAMALELARAFAKEQPPVSIYFVAVAGEEQGLIGSAHLAQRLKQEGIEVLAMTSVDIAGNVQGQNGVLDNTRGRLYSEGARIAETDAQKRLRDAVGGENDSPSREWARYIERLGERYVENLDLLVMLRRDRIARGSDHTSFNQQGFPGVRLSEMVEHYDREHQTPRVENGRQFGDDLAHFDAPYTAKLCRALAASIASLAFAPAPPGAVTLGGAVSPDTRLRWTLPKDPRIANVAIFRRRADSVRWDREQLVGKVDHATLREVIPDDEFFAVATVDEAGNESLPQPPSELER